MDYITDEVICDGERTVSLVDHPTAIYCACDAIAIGMLKFLGQSRRNYYTPSIIGSDDIDAAQFTTPMLTTMHVPKDEMVKQAVSLLLDRIQDGHTTKVQIGFESTLVKRGSCASVDESYALEYYL